MTNRQHAKSLLPALLALTLTLTGCTGGGTPSATGTPRPAATTATTTAVSTGNTTVDSALNTLGDVRTALDGIRVLGSTSGGTSATTQGFRVAGFMVMEEGSSTSPPPEFQDPFAGTGTRVEERPMSFFDGRSFSTVVQKIKIADIQDGRKHIHRETDITKGEPGVLIMEAINEALEDGRIKDSFTNFFRDPEGRLHKIVNLSIHPPFDPSRFQFDPAAPPPPPPPGFNEEFLCSSDDANSCTIKIASGSTDENGVTTMTREFDDPVRKVHIKDVNVSDPRSGKNKAEYFENGVLMFSHESVRGVKDGKVLFREIADNTFIDPAGIKHRHKSNILRLGDFFGGFVGAPAPASTTTTAPLAVQQIPPPPTSSTGGTTQPSGGTGAGTSAPAPPPLPGLAIDFPDPGLAPVPPGTLEAMIEDFVNDKLVHRLEYRNPEPGNPKTAVIKEINFVIDFETGQVTELLPDEVTVNPDGSRTVTKHLPNGNTIITTVRPDDFGPPVLEERDKDGKLVQKIERPTATSVVMTFYAPPGVLRRVIKGEITGKDSAIFQEFEIRDGKEVLVASGKVGGGKMVRTDPNGNSLNDDFGPAQVVKKVIDTDTEEQTITQEVAGKTIKIIKKVKKVRRETFEGFGSSGQFNQGQTRESEEVTGVQQIVGDGDITMDFDDDITSVEKTKIKMTFKSKLQFAGNIEKGSSQASLDGNLTTSDGKVFKMKITQTIGSLGLAGTIDLTSADGSINISMDLSSDGTGVGTVKDLKLNRRIFTISIGSSGKAVIRDAEDRLVQSDIVLFKKS